MNNPAYGIIGTPLSIELVKEVSVISGGYMPEYGRSTGGVLNVVTKSGGNELHGSTFMTFSPGALEGQRTRVRPIGQAISTDANVDLIHDFGGDLGGPIVKDRLWFYGGISFNFTRYRIEQNVLRRLLDPNRPLRDKDDVPHPEIGYDFVKDERGIPLLEKIPGTRQVRSATERGIQYLGKLTFAITPDHRLDLAVSGAPTISGGAGAWGIDPANGGQEGGAGDYSALAHVYVAESNDVTLRYSGAFGNKSTLLDGTLGWHHQRAARLPADGSALGSRDGFAGMPMTRWLRSVPVRHDVRDFRDVPDGDENCQGAISADADPEVDSDGDGNPTNDVDVKRDLQCPVTSYFTGGPGYLDEQLMDRVHGRIVATRLFQALGHHVLKAGLDIETMTYQHTKAYSGRVFFAEDARGRWFSDSRQYGFLTGPDQAVVQDVQKASSLGVSAGAFVQDSWNVMDRVTLNLGVRWDSQFLFGADGKLGLSMPYQFAPRVGAIYDITQRGASKVFASFARYYENVPLNLVDRMFPGEPQVMSYHSTKVCDPKIPAQAKGVCQSDESRISMARADSKRVSMDPNQYWSASGATRMLVDPNIQPQSQDELVLGGEYEVFPDGRVGAQYTHRYLVDVVEDMSRDEGSTYFLGNPGSGIAKDFPRAKRDYDALALFFTKGFSDGWLAQVSYTLSYLRGNIGGLYRAETGQLDPNITSDFDLRSAMVNRYGPLGGDTTHELKVYAARDVLLSELFRGLDDMRVNVGVGYRGTSGGPTSFLASHYRYGPNEVHVLPRGSGERLPFVHRFDTHVEYDLLLSKGATLAVYMDVFNLFNFQQVTGVNQSYTASELRPIVGGKPIRGEDGKLTPDPALLVHPDGTPFDPAEKNPAFGRPTGYQTPRTFRFGARVTF